MATTGRMHPFSHREWMWSQEGGDLLSAGAHSARHISFIGFNTQAIHMATWSVPAAYTGAIVLEGLLRSLVSSFVCRRVGWPRVPGRRWSQEESTDGVNRPYLR